MPRKKNIFGIGLVGAGTVGGGVAKILAEKADLLAERAGMRLEIVRVADLDEKRIRMLSIPKSRIAASADEVIQDAKVDVVLELVGGTTVAYDIVAKALKAGKSVVTANKALLAERGRDLFALAREKGLPLAFEAAVCAAIPIIRALRDGLVADRLESLLGIVNGTCNYILTQMLEKGKPYREALAEAQRLGFAEADPAFDVEGYDSAHKLALLAALGFDTQVDFHALPVEGISRLALSDLHMAREMGYVAKLLAVARPRDGRLFLSVHPGLLSEEHPLASVSGSMNAVALFGDAVGEAMYYGRGAGALPTASAVLSDVVELARARARGSLPHRWYPRAQNRFEPAALADYECPYFVRFTVLDRCGVLGAIATLLGEERVSIASVVQKGLADAGVPIVLLTHVAREGNLRRAIERIEGQDFIVAPTAVMRVEG
ncbi:MAG: homoserine dehydrogenase [Planctomycetota bacterium]